MLSRTDFSADEIRDQLIANEKASPVLGTFGAQPKFCEPLSWEHYVE